LQGTPFEFLASLLEPAALTMPSPVLYLVQYLPLLNPFRELNFGTQQSRDPQILSLLYFFLSVQGSNDGLKSLAPLDGAAIVDRLRLNQSAA